MKNHLNLIVAHDKHLGIGKNSDLPWHLPTDMAYFKKITTQHTGSTPNTVIMGRKTWESIPEKFRPLPGRTNIVLSRTEQNLPKDVLQARSLDEAIEKSSDKSQLFVIGGGQIFKETLSHPACKTLYITRIDKSYDCDTFLEDYSKAFSVVESLECLDSKTGLRLSFFTHHLSPEPLRPV
jgi:dihydrofolate reductase